MALTVMPLTGFTGTAGAADDLPPVADPIGEGNFCEDAPDDNPFTDVTEADPSYDEILCLAATEITQGTTPTTFSPNETITRRQMALFIKRLADAANALELVDLADLPDYDGDPDYSDVAAEDEEFEEAIGQLSQAEIVGGFPDGTFRPNADVSRRQMAAFVNRLQEFLAGEAFSDDGDYFDDDNDESDEVQDNLNALAAVGIFQGDGEGNVNPGDDLTRRQMANILLRHAQVNFAAGAIAGPFDAPIGPNQDLTEAPELLSVSRSGDIVTFEFDQNVPGEALEFINTDGDPGGDVASEEVSYYTGFRLYDVEGTAYYAQEAGIFDNEVRARFGSAVVVNAAARAGVYEGAVENAAGQENPASDFALQATATQAPAIPAYYPQLTFAGDLATTSVTPTEITVDFELTLRTEASATAAAALLTGIIDADDGTDEDLADEFALTGADGQIFRGLDLLSATADGQTVTVTVSMDPAIEDVPESQLRRGFISEDALDLNANATADDHILLSSAYEDIAEINGTTADPDLRTVTRGPGSNQLSFEFDEAVSIPEAGGVLDNPELYEVTNNAEQEANPASIGRSLAPADEARVMVATFTGAAPGTFATWADYFDTVTAASVDSVWADADRTDVDYSAARATNQVGSQQVGWSTPAQVLVTPVQPPVAADPTPGETALPDLVSVVKEQNEITGNWDVTFTFDDDDFVGSTAVDFSLYDAEGVRFSSDSRDILFSTGTPNVLAGTVSFTFGPNVNTTDPIFSNEQIAAAVLGTVQDSDADLTEVGPLRSLEPRITEGHFAISG